jgi:hypothetical protein
MLVPPRLPDHPPTTVVGSAGRYRSASLVLVVLVVLAAAACGGRSEPGGAVDAAGAPVTGGPIIGPASVIDGTVGSQPAADGSWRSSGLARNDSGSPGGALRVSVTLNGADGLVLGSFDTVSPVVPVLNGEQVPFALAAPGVPASRVASVRWSAAVIEASADPAGRDLQVAVYWTRAPSDSHRLNLPTYRDPAAGVVPFALYASLTNASPSAVGPSTLVVAWMGLDGRVAAVATGRATDPSGGSLDSIVPGASGDVLVLVDDPLLGPELDGLTPSTWSVAR